MMRLALPVSNTATLITCILGGLWNGRDAPPTKSGQLVSGGRVQQRIIRSRSGHTIIFDDSDSKPGITIVDQTGHNTIAFDSKKNAFVRYDPMKEMRLSAKGKSTLASQSEVSLSGSLSPSEQRSVAQGRHGVA